MVKNYRMCAELDGQPFTQCQGYWDPEGRTISSPFYPKNYPANSQCSWLLTTDDQKTFSLR